MTFHTPVIWKIASLSIPAHSIFEFAAYFVAARIYFWQRKKDPQLKLSLEQNLTLLLACIVGAFLGSRILAAIHNFAKWEELLHGARLSGLWGGKTIVGGMLGGWIGVEATKKSLKINSSTGDAYVFPLIVGMVIGRIGCFLAGLSDDTYGLPSSLPWAVDFGGGIPRHPTQLYEIGFFILLGLFFWKIPASWKNIAGVRFRLFIMFYLAFRLGIDFLKPYEPIFFRFTAIQWACLLGIFYSACDILRLKKRNRVASGLKIPLQEIKPGIDFGVD